MCCMWIRAKTTTLCASWSMVVDYHTLRTYSHWLLWNWQATLLSDCGCTFKMGQNFPHSKWQKVIVRSFRHPHRAWLPGVILLKHRSLTYQVKVRDRCVKVHVDHLLSSNAQDMIDPVDTSKCPSTTHPNGNKDRSWFWKKFFNLAKKGTKHIRSVVTDWLRLFSTNVLIIESVQGYLKISVG